MDVGVRDIHDGGMPRRDRSRPIRVVLVSGPDMLQDVLRQVVDDDPGLELVGELATAEGLPACLQRVEADVVIVRPLAADVPATVLPAGPDARIPAVVGLDQHGRRGLIVVDDISPAGLAAAIRAAAGIRGLRGAGWPGIGLGLVLAVAGLADAVSCRALAAALGSDIWRLA
jgi:hypothetical protein